MCGIYARVSKEKFSINQALNKAKRLEYRGYDSYGYLYEDGLKDVKKHIGQVILDNPLETNLFLFHCRWATHGEVSLDNTHPISTTTKSSKYYFVHNGTINNYQEIIKDNQHVIMYGETDSRAIGVLLHKHFKVQSVWNSIQTIKSKLKGTYACVFTEFGSDYLVAFRKDNPLYYNQYGEVSSDPFIKESFLLKEDEVLLIMKEYVGILRNPNSITEGLSLGSVYINTKELQEKEFVHSSCNMKDEIEEQAKIKINQEIKLYERMDLIGCGSSYYAGMLGAKYFKHICGFDARVEYASEFFPCESDISDRLFISLTQSGETLDVLEKIKILKNFGADQVVVTNNIKSTAVNIVGTENAYDIGVGVENSVAATKSFTAQCLLLLNSTGIPVNLYTDIFEEVLNPLEDMDKVAEIISRYKNCIYLGHNWNYPIALEGALKMKEVACIYTEAMPSAEFKHGSIVLAGDDILSVFIVSGETHLDRIKGNIQQIKSRNGKILTICDSYSWKEIKDVSDYYIVVPLSKNKYIQPLVNNIPLQILAYKVALIKGLNPDKPRNLAKTITVY